MTDDSSEEKRDFDFEKIEIEAYQKRVKVVIAAIAMVCYSILLFVGLVGWIFSGDILVLMRTSLLGFVGFLTIVYLLSQIGYTEPPSQPLPNHPDMLREDES